MSYCLNPSCPQPKNHDSTEVCKACGSQLLARDRYRAIKSLGKGGFGATFLCRDISLPGYPTCVIKQLRPSLNAPNFFNMAKELFEREAQTLGRIGNHPQIPRLLDYFEDDQQFYLVQDYVSGHNLHQEVKRNGTYTEAGAKQFLSEILPILKYIHSQNVIHRDIKPANIIRREQDRQLVLIDFGAVKNQISSTGLSNNSGETAFTAFAVGTAGFAPPEQISMRPVFASDIYAVAATCLYLLTGKSPKDLDFNSTTGEIMWRKYVNVSDNFAKVIETMMEASVARRYKSADEVLQALDVVPYFESLSQSLIQQPNTGGKLTGNLSYGGNGNGNGNSNGNGSAASKLAVAIRARRMSKNQQPEDLSVSTIHRSPTVNGDKTYISPSDRKMTTQSFKQIVDEKLNANIIIQNYSKGWRDFVQKDLSNLNLRKANLSGGIFHQSQLKKVDMIGANLSGADFGRANLTQAQLRNANLSKAYLGYTNLEGADLRGADLSFAHLYCANLKGANLCGANLSNAKISQEQLAQAKTNWTTTMPSGGRSFW